MNLNIDELVAIDVHTHAWKSALRVGDAPTESQQAMGNYFRYTPQHQTVPEMLLDDVAADFPAMPLILKRNAARLLGL